MISEIGRSDCILQSSNIKWRIRRTFLNHFPIITKLSSDSLARLLFHYASLLRFMCTDREEKTLKYTVYMAARKSEDNSDRGHVLIAIQQLEVGNN